MTMTSPTSRAAQIGGLSFHADEMGSGETIVVIHHSTGPLWSPFLQSLERTHHVVAPHLPGYGRSERPSLARSPRDLAVLCLQWLDQRELSTAHLVGLGFGGWVAAEMATMAQTRFTTLSLIGAAGMKPEHDMIHDPMLTSYEDYVRRGFKDETRFVDIFGTKVPPEIIELWDYSREMTVRLTWKPWMWSTSLPTLVNGVRIPVLLVWGEDDRVVPLECGERYACEFPNAQMQVIADAGHNLDLEQPEVLARAISAFVGTKGS
jgi:pimeloyl-ACP methyl ester carboxylesterase